MAGPDHLCMYAKNDPKGFAIPHRYLEIGTYDFLHKAPKWKVFLAGGQDHSQVSGPTLLRGDI